MSHAEDALRNLTAAFGTKLLPEIRALAAAVILDNPSMVDTGIDAATVDLIVEAIGLGIRRGFGTEKKRAELHVPFQEAPGRARNH
jgi:hypothetical protein